MSIEAVAAVFKAEMPPLPKIVLLHLANCALPDGTRAFPAVDRIARETGVGRSTVKRKLRQLWGYGFIDRMDWPDEFSNRVPANKRPQCWRVLLDEHGRCMGRWPVDEKGRLMGDPVTSGAPEDGGSTADPQDDNADGEDNYNVDNARLSDTESGPPARGPGADPQAPEAAPRGSADDRLGVQGVAPGGPELEPQKAHNLQEPSARERADAGGEADGGVRHTPGEPGEGEAAASAEDASKDLVCAHWRSQEAALKDAFGEPFWRSWLAHLIPESDDGTELVLAAPTRFYADWLNRRDTGRIGKVVGRRVTAVHREWCGAAHERAKAAEKAGQ